MPRSHLLNSVALIELYTFLDQLPLLLNWHFQASITSNILDEAFSARIQVQYEAENLLDDYEAFKSPDSEYGKDVAMSEVHGEEEMDAIDKALKQTEFEVKAQQLTSQLRAYQLDKPNLDKIEDRVGKEFSFIEFCWTKFQDLVTLTIPYFYEIENVVQ